LLFPLPHWRLSHSRGPQGKGCRAGKHKPHHGQSSRPSSHPKLLSGVLRNAAEATFRENPYLGSRHCFFGIEQGDGEAARVDHYDFGIARFDADDVRAKLRKLNLKFDSTNSKESFKFYDLDGFHVQVNAPDYVGHVG
jgi:hypothetical protein